MKKIVFPRPCDGALYDCWTLEKWMLKVCEECGEAVSAAKTFDLDVKLYNGAAQDAAREDATEPQNAYATFLLGKMEHARERLCLELTDVITAATSALAYLGCDFDERQSLQAEVNDKNARRDKGRRFASQFIVDDEEAEDE